MSSNIRKLRTHSEAGYLLSMSRVAQVVKLVDTLASGASALTGVAVQVRLWAPFLFLTGYSACYLSRYLQ